MTLKSSIKFLQTQAFNQAQERVHPHSRWLHTLENINKSFSYTRQSIIENFLWVLLQLQSLQHELIPQVREDLYYILSLRKCGELYPRYLDQIGKQGCSWTTVQVLMVLDLALSHYPKGLGKDLGELVKNERQDLVDLLLAFSNPQSSNPQSSNHWDRFIFESICSREIDLSDLEDLLFKESQDNKLSYFRLKLLSFLCHIYVHKDQEKQLSSLWNQNIKPYSVHGRFRSPFSWNQVCKSADFQCNELNSLDLWLWGQEIWFCQDLRKLTQMLGSDLLYLALFDYRGFWLDEAAHQETHVTESLKPHCFKRFMLDETMMDAGRAIECIYSQSIPEETSAVFAYHIHWSSSWNAFFPWQFSIGFDRSCRAESSLSEYPHAVIQKIVTHVHLQDEEEKTFFQLFIPSKTVQQSLRTLCMPNLSSITTDINHFKKQFSNASYEKCSSYSPLEPDTVLLLCPSGTLQTTEQVQWQNCALVYAHSYPKNARLHWHMNPASVVEGMQEARIDSCRASLRLVAEPMQSCTIQIRLIFLKSGIA